MKRYFGIFMILSLISTTGAGIVVNESTMLVDQKHRADDSINFMKTSTNQDQALIGTGQLVKFKNFQSQISFFDRTSDNRYYAVTSDGQIYTSNAYFNDFKLIDNLAKWIVDVHINPIDNSLYVATPTEIYRIAWINECLNKTEISTQGIDRLGHEWVWDQKWNEITTFTFDDEGFLYVATTFGTIYTNFKSAVFFGCVTPIGVTGSYTIITNINTDAYGARPFVYTGNKDGIYREATRLFGINATSVHSIVQDNRFIYAADSDGYIYTTVNQNLTVTHRMAFLNEPIYKLAIGCGCNDTIYAAGNHKIYQVNQFKIKEIADVPNTITSFTATNNSLFIGTNTGDIWTLTL